MTTTKKKVKNFRSKFGRKTSVSDLSWDLIRDIFSRVPLASLNAVRGTCKTWNDLSRNLVLGQKAAKKQHLGFMKVDNYSVRSLRFELQGIRNDEYDYDEDLADPSMKPISIPNHDQVAISKVYHCDGLLLCVTRYNPSRLLLWNPYLGKTRLIPPINKLHFLDEFALGYDNNRNHKITRFSEPIDVYDFSSDSWRVLDLERDMYFLCRGVSLKGNTYFCCQKMAIDDTEDYLLCFDFTRERFGPRLPLPLSPYEITYEAVTLSWVRDEKLALLYNYYAAYEKLDIWITTKTEPNAVLWSKFLRLDMKPLHGRVPADYWCCFDGKSFFIDEEKKVAVIFDIYEGTEENSRFKMAYIVGEDGCFRSINMGEARYTYQRSWSLACSSYVPSLVQLHV